MADRKITDLTALAAGSQATGDLLTIVDVSEGAAADKNKKITVESLFKGIPSNVGIGISSPAGKLTVYDGSSPYLYLQNSTSGTSGSDGFSLLHSGVNTFFANRDSGYMAFETGNSERLRIDSSGNTTLGYAGASLHFNNGFNNSTSRIQNSGGSNSSNFKFLVKNSGSESEAMRIDSSGRLGVGTTSPSSILHLEDSNNTIITLGNSSYDDGVIQYYNGSVLLKTGSSSGDRLMTFSTAGSERMRIDSSGRLLVGTSSNFGDGSTGDALQVATTTGGHLLLGRNDSSVAANNTIGLIRGYSYGGSAWQETARISIQADGAHASGDKPGRIVFSTTASSASSPTERMRILSSGGITFNGDTAQANALDDYEEGTWTPSIPGTSITYTNRDGHYTKIGRVVYIHAWVEWAGGGSPTGGVGAAILSGLPFTSKATDYPKLTTASNGCNFGGTVPVAQVTPNSTTISAIGVTNNANFVDSTATSVWDASGNWIMINGFYTVA